MDGSSPEPPGGRLTGTLPVVGELIVIVVGILLALGVDAWWADVTDRREEREVLAAINAEFEENRELLNAALDHHESIQAAVVTVLESAESACGAEVDTAIGVAVLHWRTLNPVVGATQSLIASGRLSLISDRSLRARLAAWDGLVSDLIEDETRTVLRRDALADYVAAKVPDYDCRALVTDPSFKALLELRHFEEREVLTKNERVSETVEGILAATEAYRR